MGKRREGDEFAPSLGKVPILWDGECVVWDSLAIIDFLATAMARGFAQRGARLIPRQFAIGVATCSGCRCSAWWERICRSFRCG